MTKYAVILTHNRPEALLESVRAIATQADRVIVVDNASDPPVTVGGAFEWPFNVQVVQDPTQPPNLARMWNQTLNRIQNWESQDGRFPDSVWEVAFLCDDVNIPDGWFDAVVSAMRSTGAAAGSTHQIDPVGSPVLKTVPDSDVFGRMCGWAFIVAGESRIRADESLKWWWCDTDLDWTARAAGGMVIAPGPVALNARPGEWTNAKPELGAQAGADGATFVAKHGWRPW